MNSNKNQDRRVEMTVEGLRQDYEWHVRYTLAKYRGKTTPPSS